MKKKPSISLVWADKNNAQSYVAEAKKDLKAAVAAIFPALCEANNKACVEAGFRLDALVMAALAPRQSKFRQELAFAMMEHLTLLPDDYALCLMLQGLQKLSVPKVEAGMERILQLSIQQDKKDVFVYALNVLRVLKTPEAYAVLEGLAQTEKDEEYRTSLLQAALENATPSGELLKFAMGCAEKNCLSSYRIRLSLAKSGCWEAFPLYLETLDASGKQAHVFAVQAMDAFFGNCVSAPEELKRQYAMQYLEAFPSAPALAACHRILGESDEFAEILYSAIRAGDGILRAAALGYFEVGFSGANWTEKLVAFAISLRDSEQICSVIESLGVRQDSIALGFLLARLHAAVPEQRLAAMKALRCFPPAQLPAATLAVGMI